MNYSKKRLSKISDSKSVKFTDVQFFLIQGEENIQRQIIEKPTRQKTVISMSKTNGLAIAGYSLAWKLMRRNSIRPEEKAMNLLLEGYKRESRPYVLNPKYASPTSLPLYFYFGYQLLLESKLMQECGHVCTQSPLKELMNKKILNAENNTYIFLT